MVPLDGGCFDGDGPAVSTSVDSLGTQFRSTGYRIGACGRILIQLAMVFDHGVK